MLVSINPTTGERLASYPDMSDAEVDAALASVAHAFHEWRRGSFADRARVIHAAAAQLRSRKGELARLMALEMGKPVSQGESEIEKCATARVLIGATVPDGPGAFYPPTRKNSTPVTAS